MDSHPGHTAVDGVNSGPYPHLRAVRGLGSLLFIAFDQVGDGAADAQGSL